MASCFAIQRVKQSAIQHRIE